MKNKFKRSYIREILDVIDEDTISFAGGLPKEELFPLKKIQKATSKVLQIPKSLQYSSSKGLKCLRKKIADIYTNKLDFPTSEEEIIITNGSQQAFDIILKIINEKKILLEEPSYIGALSSFNILNKKVDSFCDFDELNRKIEKKSLLYLISDFQNPSTSSYSNKQRKEFAKIINKNKCYVMEDGAYTFLDFKNKFKTPISKYCKDSFHLGSFSKIIAPGLRVGWIRANSKLINKVLIAKEALDLHTSTLNQMILDEYLNENDIFEHIKKINNDYFKNMQYMSKYLDKYIPSFSYCKPKGGMFIYGSLSCDTMKLAKHTIKKNLAIVPAEVFYLNKKSKEIRLNFTNSSKKEIKKGLKILKECLYKGKI